MLLGATADGVGNTSNTYAQWSGLLPGVHSSIHCRCVWLHYKSQWTDDAPGCNNKS